MAGRFGSSAVVALSASRETTMAASRSAGAPVRAYRSVKQVPRLLRTADRPRSSAGVASSAFSQAAMQASRSVAAPLWS